MTNENFTRYFDGVGDVTVSNWISAEDKEAFINTVVLKAFDTFDLMPSTAEQTFYISFIKYFTSMDVPTYEENGSEYADISKINQIVKSYDFITECRKTSTTLDKELNSIIEAIRNKVEYQKQMNIAAIYADSADREVILSLAKFVQQLDSVAEKLGSAIDENGEKIKKLLTPSNVTKIMSKLSSIKMGE